MLSISEYTRDTGNQPLPIGTEMEVIALGHEKSRHDYRLLENLVEEYLAFLLPRSHCLYQ